VIKFPSGRLLIGVNSSGGLSANGVLFTSSADDTTGDTAGDGFTTGSGGQWRGLVFGSHCLSSPIVSCTVVRFAGQAEFRGVQVLSSSPRIQYCQFVNNFGDGLYVSGSTAAPFVFGCTISGNSDYGVDVVSDGAPLLRFNNLQGNTAGAVRTSSTTVVVDAVYNWWGSATGPSDPSAGPPDQNAGSGAGVSDYVSYRSWMTAPSTTPCVLTVSVPTVMVDADVSFDAVKVTWAGMEPGAETFSVQRRVEGGDWRAVGSPEVSQGTLSFLDRDVRPATRYEYRLASPAGSETFGWVSAFVPERPLLALQGARPNPARGTPLIALTLADASPASLQVFDVSGRRMQDIDLEGLGPGFHTVRLRSLPPAIYLVRLRQGSTTLIKRVLVVN
jgi:parallel beta-helix repeat protein